MKFLGRRNDAGDPGAAVDPDGTADSAEAATRSGMTAPKGRPTPKRDARGRRGTKRGPVVPAPMTAAEARARRKALAGPKLSREERRQAKLERRERMTERRERMLAGDEAYLLERDRGPVRRYVRDVVDARRGPLGLFFPAALGMLFAMMALPPEVQPIVSSAMMLLMVGMAIDAVVLGRKVIRLVDGRFPDDTESRWKLALYAAGRASQPRRMRAPRAQVNRGDRVG